MALRKVGNFVARGADRVDPLLIAILEEAARRANLDVEAYSGYRPGDRRQHGRGKATDIRLIGPNGQALPNYQSPETFAPYEKFAQEARRVQMEQHPELAQAFRWGGYFGGPKGKYGAMDLMHFDLGGTPHLGMAGGSWDTGLTDAQKALFPGIKSSGMGGMAPGSPAPPMGEPIQVSDAPVAGIPGSESPPEGPQSALGKLFAGMGPIGGGQMVDSGAFAPGISRSTGDMATAASQQSAEKAKQLAMGLAPNVEAMLSLKPSRKMMA